MKSSPDAELRTIGQAAEVFGLATHVLRHWESMGLLTPARVEGDRRRYSREDLFRIAVIMRAKEAGLSLDEIAEMTAADPTVRRAMLRRRRSELIARIEAAKASLELVECAIDCDRDDITTCPNFRESVTPEWFAAAARAR